jgi:hypothetical protein
MTAEAQRQQALIAALLAPPGRVNEAGLFDEAGLHERGERAARGIDAYRANAEAVAERALAAVFGTVQALLGEENFARLAAEFWRAAPPLRGDVGEWGGAFPAWLGAHAGMAPWPYLADCARLDLALHHNERAADGEADAESLNLLASTDPSQLVMVLMPGTELLLSRWPLAAIHHAHHVPPDEADAAFEAVRGLLGAVTDSSAQSAVLVARAGWRAVLHTLDAPGARWTQSLLDGQPLDQALAMAGEGFDFAAWLATALRHGWLKGAAVCAD